jgi:hypothetical protein
MNKTHPLKIVVSLNKLNSNYRYHETKTNQQN